MDRSKHTQPLLAAQGSGAEVVVMPRRRRERRKAVSFRQRDVARPPEGPWFWHNDETIKALLKLSLVAMRFVFQLEREHMRHAGLENGNLAMPRRQSGVHPASFKAAVAEAIDTGWIEMTQRATRNSPARYRLTNRPTKAIDEYGREVWAEPTHDWKRVRQRLPEKENEVYQGYGL